MSLFRLKDEGDPEPITTIASSEPILSVADVVLQEHDLTLVRSAVTLTVSGELEEPDPDELEDEEEDIDDESETYELLVSFMVEGEEYGLYIPLDPFFVVARWLMDRPNWWKGKTSIAFNPGSKRNSTNVIQGNDQQASSGA